MFTRLAPFASYGHNGYSLESSKLIFYSSFSMFNFLTSMSLRVNSNSLNSSVYDYNSSFISCSFSFNFNNFFSDLLILFFANLIATSFSSKNLSFSFGSVKTGTLETSYQSCISFFNLSSSIQIYYIFSSKLDLNSSISSFDAANDAIYFYLCSLSFSNFSFS